MTDENDQRTMLPSERAEKIAEAQQHNKEIAGRRTSMLREDFGRTFQTEHGKRVLAWMFERSGYGKSKVAMSRAGVDKDMTLFLAQEETFYIEVRKHIPVDVLAQVEYGKVRPSGTIEDNDVINQKIKKQPKKKG